MSLKILTWNVKWATPRLERTLEIQRRINEQEPEIICLTESDAELLAQGLLAQAGHVVSSQPDYGYPIYEGRRKVALWSKKPWRDVDKFGSKSLPPGRFVSGVTETSLGDVTVIGVCIPWRASRTDAWRGMARRRWWEDHEDYLDEMPGILESAPTERVIVMGDFNQRIGEGSTAPLHLREKLCDVFTGRIRIVTADVEFGEHKTIDHIALSDDLVAEPPQAISNLRDDGGNLSDHFGVAAEVTFRRS